VLSPSFAVQKLRYETWNFWANIFKCSWTIEIVLNILEHFVSLCKAHHLQIIALSFVPCFCTLKRECHTYVDEEKIIIQLSIGLCFHMEATSNRYAGFKILQLLLIQLQKRPVFVTHHSAFELQTQSGRCKRGWFLSLISMLLGFKHKVAETGTGSNETVMHWAP
jgi:hypothetical protein